VSILALASTGAVRTPVAATDVPACRCSPHHVVRTAMSNRSPVLHVWSGSSEEIAIASGTSAVPFEAVWKRADRRALMDLLRLCAGGVRFGPHTLIPARSGSHEEDWIKGNLLQVIPFSLTVAESQVRAHPSSTLVAPRAQAHLWTPRPTQAIFRGYRHVVGCCHLSGL
jgi:hypothetical protein